MLRYRYMVPVSDAVPSMEFIIGERWFRPTEIVTNVTKPGAKIIDVLFNGVSQFVGPVDAYEFSAHLTLKTQAKFLKEHGLESATDEQIQAFLDEREWSMPGHMHLDLPTLKKGDKVTVIADGNFVVGIMGWVDD